MFNICIAKGDPKKALVYLLILVAFASALLDNVTTILLAVPMTLVIYKQLNVNPVPFLLAEVFVSNIGGAATLVGDPPNIIIASRAGLSFNDFLIHMAPGAIVASWAVIGLLDWMSRKELKGGVDPADLDDIKPAAAITDRPLLNKSLIVLGLVLAAFVAHA